MWIGVPNCVAHLDPGSTSCDVLGGICGGLGMTRVHWGLWCALTAARDLGMRRAWRLVAHGRVLADRRAPRGSSASVPDHWSLCVVGPCVCVAVVSVVVLLLSQRMFDRVCVLWRDA